MDVRTAITNFIAVPGDQWYGDDREPLQRGDNHAVPNGNAVTRAADDASDLFRGVPVELGALSQYVRQNFHSDSPSEMQEQATLTAALSDALLSAGAIPREAGPDHGQFNRDVRIDTSRTSVSPAPPMLSDPAVRRALTNLVERSPGQQWTGTLREIESDQGAVQSDMDHIAKILEVYSLYTQIPAPMEEAKARSFMRVWITNGFVRDGGVHDDRLDPKSIDALIDELLAYAKRSVDQPAN